MPIYNFFDEDSLEFLKKLPYRQFYIFVDSDKGIDKRVEILIEKIRRAVRMVTKLHRIPPIFVMPSDYMFGGEYVACVISKNDGATLELADCYSVIEMVYDFYGVDFMENRPNFDGWGDTVPYTTIKGHPTKFHIDRPSINNESADNGDESSEPSSMAELTNTTYSKEEATKKILNALWDADKKLDKGVTLDYKQILEEFDIQRKKEYTLKIEIQLPKNISCDSDKPRTRDCHFYMVDEDEKEYEILQKIEPAGKAVYLMFLLFEKGIILDKFMFAKTAEQYENVFKQFQNKMADGNYSNGTLTPSSINMYRSQIKADILKVTQNQYLEKFCIEGFRGKEFKIDIATQEQREYVIKMFHLDMTKIEE